MPSVTDTIDALLGSTASAAVTDSFARGWESAAPEAEFPLAQRSEILDSVTCRLCRAVDGRTVRRDDPWYRRFIRQLHINCRGIWLYIHRDEVDRFGKPTAPDWPGADEVFTDDKGREASLRDLIDAHGHFVAEPEKYSALNLPVRPEGRDVIFYREKLPGGGLAPHVTARWRDGMPKWAVRETLQSMAGGLPNPLSLQAPGDLNLALQVMWHAGRAGLWRGLPSITAERAGAWPGAGTLTEAEIAPLPVQMMQSGEAFVGTHPTAQGTPQWFLYAEQHELAPGRTLDEVAAIYRPLDADFVDVQRLAP